MIKLKQFYAGWWIASVVNTTADSNPLYIYIYIITLQMTYDKTMHENKSYKNEHLKSAEKLTDFIDALKEGKEVKSLTLVGRWFQASTLL